MAAPTAASVTGISRRASRATGGDLDGRQPQREERRTLHRDQRQHGQRGGGRERREDVRHPGDVAVGPQRYALEQPGEQRAPAQRGERAAGHDHPVPARPGPLAGRPAAQLHPGGHQDHPGQRADHGG